MEKIYLSQLDKLKNLADNIPNTKMMAQAKILTLIILNMRYEPISINQNLKTHPYILVNDLVKNSISFLSAMNEIKYIEDPSSEIRKKENLKMEQEHEELFQKLWVKFSIDEYKKRIERYIYRLQINGLNQGLLNGSKCIDFGCGHGNFAHALLKAGANYVYGIDFGKNNILYAINARDHLGIKPDQIDFKVETVYNVSKKDNSFDFAVQNGVFHHLENEDAAYKEVWRILKPNGLFWIYTNGYGSINNDLWEVSKYILKEIEYDFIISYIDSLNIETGKKYHLGDGLNAIYRYTSWDDLTQRLSKCGFENFKRLIGGFPTDYDHDVIAKDKYGKEKFGEGNIRILAQKKNKK